MPVYNGSAFLLLAIRSVLGQTYANLELRIFDDCSTDGSAEVLRLIDDSRVIIMRNEHNLGPEGNWNRALAAGRGKYIKLFHQDDLMLPDCLAEQVAALELHPDAVLAFCRRDIIGADGRKLLSRGAGWGQELVPLKAVALRCAWHGTNVVGEPSAVLLRAETVAKVGGFDASVPYLIDLDYWVRMMAYGPAWYSDTALAAFRVSSQQWSAAIGGQQARHFNQFLDRMAQQVLRGHGVAVAFGKLRAHMNGVLRAILYRVIRG